VRALTFACLVLTVAAPAQDAGAPADDLLGTWYAEPTHAGTKGHVGLDIVRDGGRVIAKIALLDLQPQPVPFAYVQRAGNKVHLGPLVLEHDAEAGTLRGTFPEELVPVHAIAVEFRRAPLPQSAPAAAEIPTVAPVWRHALGGAVWGGVTFKGGVVYSGCDDGALHALDARTGKERWRVSTGAPVRARPIVHGEVVFAASDDGNLYALDARTGAERWKSEIGKAIERADFGAPEFRYDHQAPAPTVAGDTVFAASTGGQLVALDLATGKERWRFRAADISTSTPAVRGETVFFASFDGHAYAVDARTGELRWKHDFGAEVPTSPAPCDDLVLFGSRSYDLVALRADDGAPAWSYYFWFSWAESSPTVRDRIAYAGSSDGQLLVALDAKTGKEKWRFDTGGSAWGQPAVTADAVFLGAVGVAEYMIDHEGAFFAVERATGEPRWRFPAERRAGERVWGFASSPAVGDGRVYVGSLDGSVLAFPEKSER
jgi:outer membrane protein assembly factor BamB